MTTLTDDRTLEVEETLRSSTVEELLGVIAGKRGHVDIDARGGSVGSLKVTVSVASSDGRARFEGESHDNGLGLAGLRAHLANVLVQCFQQAVEYAQDRDAADRLSNYGW